MPAMAGHIVNQSRNLLQLLEAQSRVVRICCPSDTSTTELLAYLAYNITYEIVHQHETPKGPNRQLKVIELQFASILGQSRAVVK